MSNSLDLDDNQHFASLINLGSERLTVGLACKGSIHFIWYMTLEMQTLCIYAFANHLWEGNT